MNYQLLYNKILRLPFKKALKLLDEYKEKYPFKNFAEQQRVLDLMTEKGNFATRVKPEVMQEAVMYLYLASGEKNELSYVAFTELKKHPMVVWIELIGVLEEEKIIKFLKNYSHRLPSSIIETCIINAREEIQSKLIEQYSKKIDANGEFYKSFYFAVGDEARKTLDKIYPENMTYLPLLKIEDLKEEEIFGYIGENVEAFKNVSIDIILEKLLLKVESMKLIFQILLTYFKEKMNDLSDEKFEFLITRYMYVREKTERHSWSWLDYDIEEDEEEKEDKEYKDTDLLDIFENRFRKLGLVKTLSLFNVKASYDGNEAGEYIIYKFLDDAYDCEEIKPFVNDKVKEHLIVKFSNDCKNKEYSEDEFVKLVDKISTDRNKLIYDDFIEAIIACGQLLKKRIINDKNEHFIKLRNLFKETTMTRVIKDGTCLDDVNLNGIFYRLAKGSLDFDKFYLTKTYKGIIYLSKSGMLVDNADTVTQFLTDEQLFKLDITPMLRWKKNNTENNLYGVGNGFFERMSLQLLLFFGELRAKHILDAEMKSSRMENLFDGINYKDIKIDENGRPIVNNDLMEFLFGRGSVKETQNIMNKLIKGEIPEFGKYFKELCNDYENLVEKCNGILSVKRLVRYLEEVNLPVDLKPNQYRYRRALKEMNTQNDYLLKQAVLLCDHAAARTYSTIPKVKGKMGDFTYEILDYKDSFALAVGYLSHCCFIVDGISHTALEHSMNSINGRTFIVYYKNKFLTQSWIWRNGNVVCFDSVEAGSPIHGSYNDEINLVDVYKRAAQEILDISKNEEDELQQVKVVTVGKSDYIFKSLEKVEGNVARPLEQNVYVYDSREQSILAGEMSKKPFYGQVGAKYQDERKKVLFVKDINNTDIDTLDVVFNQLYSIKYQATGDEMPPVLKEYKKVVIGEDWFITMDEFCTLDYGVLMQDNRAYDEFKKYATIFGIDLEELEKDNINDGPILAKKGGN